MKNEPMSRRTRRGRRPRNVENIPTHGHSPSNNSVGKSYLLDSPEPSSQSDDKDDEDYSPSSEQLDSIEENGAVNDDFSSELYGGHRNPTNNGKIDYIDDDYDSFDDDYEDPKDDNDFTIGKQHSKNKKRKLSKSTTNKKVKRQATAKNLTNQESSIAPSTHIQIEKSSESTTSNNQQNSLLGLSNNLRIILSPNNYKFEQIFPPELLIRIFSFFVDYSSEDSMQNLTTLAQVCEHWRQIIITTPTLWSRLNLSSLAESRVTLERFRRMHEDHRLFKAVRHIDLSNWRGEMAWKMLKFITDCSQYDLQSLSIRYCRNISTSFLKSIITYAGNLRLLNISGITTLHQNCQNPFSTAAFKPLIERCGKSLRSLYMAENMMVSFSMCFSLLLEFCPNIQVLDISNVTSMGSRASTIPIEKFQQCCPNIRVLRAANVSFQTSPLCQSLGWAQLEELSIPSNVSYCMSAGHNDQIIEQLTKTSENLTLLDIRGSPLITPRGLVKIPAWSLKHLSISNCPKMQDESLGMVFQKWKSSLVDVDLSWNKSELCIDECIRSICDVQKDELKLKTIDLRGSAISLETLRRFILHCGDQLKTIDLQSCRSLPRGMKRLFQGKEFQQLRQYMLDGQAEANTKRSNGLSSQSYILPDLYENWFRMFRKNHQYRSVHLKRKLSERKLMSLLDEYKTKLNTETLALMQEMNWNQMEPISGRKFEPKFEQIGKETLTIEEYIRWLLELENSTEEFKAHLIDIENQYGWIF